MNISEIGFWVLSAVAIFSSLMVITRKNPIYSVLFLIITFFALSGHYVLMNAQFLALVNIIVYAGAIMVLFLFVLMLMNLNKELDLTRNKMMLVFGSLAGFTLMIVLILALYAPDQPKLEKLGSGDIGLVEKLGAKLFSDYVVPFEISSILFLSAMVGAVVLSRKHNQNPIN